MPLAKVSVDDPLGMHLRMAFSLADLCSRRKCAVRVGFGGQWADGKELTAVLGLGVESGETITLETSGPEAEVALEELRKFFAPAAKTP